MDDNLKLKEYYQYFIPETLDFNDPSYIPTFDVEKNAKYWMQPKNYQHLVSNFLNPNKKNSRLLLKWDPGVGKTITALMIAMEFIKLYELDPNDDNGSVIVLGFTEEIFKKELLRRPRFGFVTNEELDKLNSLQSGSSYDQDKLNELNMRLRKRITSRKNGGFFKFYGYKAFVNRIFDLSASSKNINEMSESEIASSLKDGSLKWNMPLLKSFKNCLFICDEIHAVYNSVEKNNWGVALMMVLHYHYKNIFGLFMTATPVSNSPSEIVDVINLLNTPNDSIARDKLFKDDKLIPGAKKIIRTLTRGKVSFIQDINPKYFASQEFLGETIKGIPYLKFVRCPMSPAHYSVYKKVYTGAISQDSQYILDAVLPNPLGGDGLYRSMDIKRNLHEPPRQWFDKFGFKYADNIITGHGFLENNIKLWSTKYWKLLQILKDLLSKNSGKIFIYHNMVHMTGVLFIEQLLQSNGYIALDQSPTDNTLCSICGRQNKQHGSKKNKSNNREDTDTKGGSMKDHEFKAARFMMAHSELDKRKLIKTIQQTYNSAENVNGTVCKIIVGSEIIKESYNFTAVRHQIIARRPDNIPTLLQILGRVRRSGSHDLLPPDKRHVSTTILTSCIPIKDSKTKKYALGHEETKYALKVKSYKIIQEIEKILHENAIDNIIMRKVIERGLNKNKQALGSIWFKPDQKMDKNIYKYKLKDLNTVTFDVFHSSEEINTIIYIIKRLYIEKSTVFTYKMLWDNVRDPHFDAHVNTQLFQEDYFIIALSSMLFNETDITFDKKSDKNNLIGMLQNNIDKRIIMPTGNIGYIHNIDKYYIFIPINDSEHMRYPELHNRIAIGKKYAPVNVYKYIKKSSNVYDYGKIKLKFKLTYSKLTLEQLIPHVSKYSQQFHLEFIEEIIKYMFGVWTDPSMVKSDMHDIYLKVLYYYDLIGLIAWVSSIKEYVQKKYLNFVLPIDKNDKESKLTISSSSSDPDMPSSALKTIEKEYFRTLKLSMTIFGNTDVKKKVKRAKVSANILPVGHFIDNIPKFYHPDTGWQSDSEYMKETSKFVENPLIIGYHERAGFNIKFKIRKPIQFIEKHSDQRLVEKGSACQTHSKTYLVELTKKLKMQIRGKMTIPNICKQIEQKLLVNELNERRGKTNIKWFYSFWSTRPEKHVHKSVVSSQSE
jgi:hypothetical protein